MDEAERRGRNDPLFSGKAPTLSGYMEYAAAMDGNDLARKSALAAQTRRQSHDHMFRPKPAIVHYGELYRAEHDLIAHSLGQNHFSGCDTRAFAAYARHHHVARLNDPGDRKAAEEYIGTRHEQWRREHGALEARQHAWLERDVADGVWRRQSRRDNRQRRDTSAFFARAEVVVGYCIEHEALNTAFEKDISKFVDNGVARQVDRNRQAMNKADNGIGHLFRRASRQPERGRPADQSRER